MNIPDKNSASPPRMADRLAAVRRGRFVGREMQVDLFRAALLADEAPFAALFLFGPGGVGKTTLLREFERLARQAGRPVVYLDGRNLKPSPAGFTHAWQQAAAALEHDPNADVVLLIDTCEQLTELEGWLRRSFFPSLPPSTLIVLAGRSRPSPGWYGDAGWGSLMRILPLRNFRPEESQTYLTVRGIPPSQHAAVLNFTHGHPLALSLVGDLFQQGEKLAAIEHFKDPDLVRILLERFTQNIPDAHHRDALEICTHVRVTNEGLLIALQSEIIGRTTFAWLRELSFIQSGIDGVFPHDLARDVLDADLRWRNPEAYQALHRKIRLHYGQQLREHGHQSSIAADLIYQNRYHSAVNPFFGWDTLSQVLMETATPDDHGFILETLRKHEGEASATIADYWLKRQPEGFSVFRSGSEKQLAWVAVFTLVEMTAEDVEADPAIASARRFIHENGPLPTPEEPVNYVRFWMGRERYQDAETQSLVAMRAGGGWISRPQMSWTFAATADRRQWQAMFDQFNFDYTGKADFVVDGHRFGVFTHDWRVEPVADWGYRIEALQLGLSPGAYHPATGAPQPIVLSRPVFDEAVRQALRDFARPDLLAKNPLVRSRLVTEEAGDKPGPAALQALLTEAAGALKANPREAKFFDAVNRTYLKPAPTQEAAAELLDLPLGTYRYRLARGIERIADYLWRREN